MLRFLKIVGLLLVALIGILIFNAVRYTPVENAPARPMSLTTPNGNLLARQLSQAITYKTISYESGSSYAPDTADRYASFTAFQQWLQSTYPDVFHQLTLTRINQHTLLFR